MKNFFTETTLGNILNGVSQLGNMLSSRHADISISSRVGKGALDSIKFYLFLQLVIDYTFYPLEGKGHCLNAYKNDPKEDFEFGKDGIYSKTVISLFVCTICPILAVLFWTYYGVKSLFNIIRKKLF